MNDQLTEHMIGAAIEVHRLLGPGLLESVYEETLCVELQLRGIAFERQVSIDIVYKGQRLDLLVEGQVVVELKSQTKLPETTVAQVLSYLKATGLRRGLLMNFGLPRLRDGIKHISL